MARSPTSLTPTLGAHPQDLERTDRTVRGEPAPFAPASESSADPLIGRVLLGKYRIDAVLGAGGMGAVYRATQLAVARLVAVKVLRQVEGVSDEQLGLRFQREALATSRLKHPNTVQVFDFGQTEDHILFMVLELLEGAPLSEVISSEAPLPPARVSNIGRQISKSLAEAHELGIVHRDLKPDNVFLCQIGRDSDVVKVMDFGIARLTTMDSGMTQTGMMIGTPKYIAPEQAMGQKVGPEADLYALGVMLYEMLTGKPLFEADSMMALAYAHVHDPIPRLELRGVEPSIQEAWRDILTHLLAKSPRDRPSSATEVATWLQRIEVVSERAEGLARNPLHKPLPGREPTGIVPLLQRTSQHRKVRRRRSSTSMVLLAIAFMSLGGVLAWWLAR